MKKLIIAVLAFSTLTSLVFATSDSDVIIKEVEKVKTVIVPYENKTTESFWKLLSELKRFYWTFDTMVADYEWGNYDNDPNYEKLKSYYSKEISFIKQLDKKGISLKEEEKKAFFKFIGEWKAISEISSKDKEPVSKILSFDKWDGESSFYKVTLNQVTQSISIMKRIDWSFQTVYWGKLDIPLEAKIYDIRMIYSKDNKVPYLITQFLTLNWLWTSIMSVSISWWNIDLVSDVSWIFINNSTNYHAYKQADCDQKLKYFQVKDGTLYGYCLSKNDKTLITNALIK